MFLSTQFRIIWMCGNKDKEIRDITLYFLFVLLIFQSHPSVSFIISDFLIETQVTYQITYDNQLNSLFT